MSNYNNSLACAASCWFSAGAVGLIATGLFIVMGEWQWPQAIFAAGLITLAAGGVLAFATCRSQRPGDTDVSGTAARDALLARKQAAKNAVAQARGDAPAKAAKPAAPKPAAAAPAASGDFEDVGTRPARLDAPRDGKADDLKEIKGVGPKLEELCHELGFYHFDQIAAWTADEVEWVDANLQGFKGRVTRDDWVAQAKVLAAGGETEFSKRVESGSVY